jgi:esterase/lipase
MEREQDVSEFTQIGRWFFAKGQNCLGTVLLAHGLNQRPASWGELINELTGWGLDVLRLGLTGHRGLPFADMHHASAEIWLEEFEAALAMVGERHPDRPLYLIGYSLGGLLAVVTQIRQNRGLFDRQVLLAPALAVRTYTLLVLPMTWLFSSLPSRAPRVYLANQQGTTASAYRALFRLKVELAKARGVSVINIPTRVIMCDHDELVSHRGIARFIASHDLNRWRLITIPPVSNKRLNTSFRHLIVDSRALGHSAWSQMISTIRNFLLNGDGRR